MELQPFPDDWSSALCIAAHPDDLEYGTAAAVARWTTEGRTVRYLLATRGEAGIDDLPPAEAGPLREQEERDGARVVGVEEVDFLDFADGTVEHGLPLRRAIAAGVRRVRPDLVVTSTFAEFFPGGFANQADHRAVGLAVLDACADAGNRWIFPELLEEGLPPWTGVRYVAIAAAHAPTHVLDVTDTFEAAVGSLATHERYLSALGPQYPTPRQLLGEILGGPEGADAPRKTWSAQLVVRR